jgi:hypothetical protein
MTDSFIAKSMFKVLAGKDRGLADRFLAMQERALTDWIPLLRVDKGSHSGLVHLINVGRNVDKMIPDGKKEELSAGEIFLLLAAVLFHDIGRILASKKEKHSCGREGPCKLDEDGNDDSPCMKDEWDHFAKSEKVILAIGQEQGLPDDMAVKYYALLAYCHGLLIPPRTEQATFPALEKAGCTLTIKHRPEFRNTSIEPLGPVRIPLLAAVLRIADETENHWTRAITTRWYDYLEKNKANLRKAFRRRVEDVEFSHAGHCIVMHIQEIPKDKDKEELKRFAGVARGINSVLQHWSAELRPLDIEFQRVLFESEGKLWRFDDKAPFETVKTQGDWKTIVPISDAPKRVAGPMAEVLKLGALSTVALDDHGRDPEADGRAVRGLREALERLSNITMGYEDFAWAAVEAEAGRPLSERDRWLVERMADWVPGDISIDPHRQSVHVRKKSDWAKMSRELIGK